MRLFLLAILLLGMVCVGEEPPQLKIRQPNWRPHVLENFLNGNPAHVLFYEPLAQGERTAKELLFYPNGRVKEETDLESDKPHGASVSYHLSGAVKQAAHFQQGVLNGPFKTFYSNGTLETSAIYADGSLHGIYEAFYSNGNKKEEGTYEQGKLVGNFLTYHNEGSRSSQIHYEQGLPHGNAMEWYPKEEYEGGLKASRNYVDGLLHGDGKTPAVMIYGPELSLLEVQDFRYGKPFGLHLRYSSSGQVGYRVNYVNGVKDGKEQYFDDDGKVTGGGTWRAGVPVGEHFQYFAGGELQKRARYSGKGELLEPICEYYENGNPKASYILAQE
ncbi:MAG TPA: toxin-antitoxin system YwqK family antitoxin, partial [Waddliaceae bacterium]